MQKKTVVWKVGSMPFEYATEKTVVWIVGSMTFEHATELAKTGT